MIPNRFLKSYLIKVSATALSFLFIKNGQRSGHLKWDVGPIYGLMEFYELRGVSNFSAKSIRKRFIMW